MSCFTLMSLLLPLLWQGFLPGQERSRLVDLSLSWQIQVRKSAPFLELTAVVPRTWAPHQRLLSLRFSSPPERVWYVGEVRYARWRIPHPPSHLEISLRARLRLFSFPPPRASFSGEGAGLVSGASWLRAEPFLESNHPLLREAAARLKGSSPLAAAKSIYTFVARHMTYGGYRPESIGALQAYRLGSGDCSDYADLMVGLCRAKGLPARTIYGFSTSFNSTPKHAWVEVFVKGKGWLAADPLLGDLRQQPFGVLAPHDIYLSNVRNDKRLRGYYYYAFRIPGGEARVLDRVSIRKLAPPEPSRGAPGMISPHGVSRKLFKGSGAASGALLRSGRHGRIHPAPGTSPRTPATGPGGFRRGP